MAEPQWRPVPLDAKVLLNVKEACLTSASAAVENAYFNESRGQSRFPGLKPFATLIGNQPVYLHEWRGDLMAATVGRLFRINRAGTVEDVTDVQISGNQRVIFTRTPNELVLAAGGQLIRFAGARTEVLSEDAPIATHVGFIDAYLVANERVSGRFFYSDPNDFRTWPALNVFTVNGNPDDINGFLVTPFRELLFSGIDSVEQFERLNSDVQPFYRRWAVGEGVWAPYTLIFADNATWFVNKKYEFVRLQGQTPISKGDDVDRVLDAIDDWREAWTSEMTMFGQKFIVLQAPMATNVYGTKGVTLLIDMRKFRWFSLYDWDSARAVKSRWPGWSYYNLWGRNFVGGNGVVLELDDTTYTNNGNPQKVHSRTGHLGTWGHSSVLDVRMRVKRGQGTHTTEPVIGLRCLRDNKHYTRWNYKSLGKAGDDFQELYFGEMGDAHTWQFQIDMSDAAEFEVVQLEAKPVRVGW